MAVTTGTPGNAEAATRSAVWERALARHELPGFVVERLHAAAAGRTPWLSTMTPAELRLARSHGIRPIASVSGTCWYQYGRSWTEGHAAGWRAALQRLKAEAIACGANAVVDVKMRTVPSDLGASMDYTLLGTAVRMDGLPASADPVVATVRCSEDPVGLSPGMNVNYGAMSALQALSSTNRQLTTVQSQIATGLRVSSAKDNGAIWSIAQAQRFQVLSLSSVTDSLNRAASVLDVAMTAGQTISDLLNQMKAKALAASDTSLSTADRSALNADFQAFISPIKNVVANGAFDGCSVIKKRSANLYVPAGPNGTSKLTLVAQPLDLGGSNLTVTVNSNFYTATTASNLLTTINASITNVNAVVAEFGAEANAFKLA